MCLACSRLCCDTDHLAECGCQDCFEPNCWPGWEASERDYGDETTVSARTDPASLPGGGG